MAECEHLARTSAYFDGALPADDEASAILHIGTCEACQQLLATASGLDAVASTMKPARIGRAKRRWPLPVAFVASLGAAAALWMMWPRAAAPTQVANELPRERSLVSRFTGDEFARYRPLNVLRGDHATESISLSTLAAFESRRDDRDLVAALAATGDVTRARELVEKFGDDAASDSDRAAVALAAGDSETALGFAYHAADRDPKLLAGWWNLALAAHERGLDRVSRAAFANVAAAGEPGWADEAHRRISELDRELSLEDIEWPAFEARGHKMINGGATITEDDVRRFPALARIDYFDTLRVAPHDQLENLRPIARELDAVTRTQTGVAALDRVGAAEPKSRARFASQYRAVLDHTISGREIAQLIDQLRAAGRSMDDVRAGAIILGGLAASRVSELAAIIAPWHDAWFDLAVERERIHAAFPGTDLRAEPALRAALEHCDVAFAFRCGQLGLDLAQLLADTGRELDAETWAVKALAWMRKAVMPTYVETARAQLADLHRHLGRHALARAELEEIERAVGDRNCDLHRFATIGQANLALGAGDWKATRRALVAAATGKGCTDTTDIVGVATAVDLARHTGDSGDLAMARDWMTRAETAIDEDHDGIALIGALRLANGGDAAATSAVVSWLDSHPPSTPRRLAVRTWGFTTLLADAGHRREWQRVIDIATSEHGASTSAACTVTVTYDDGIVTVAARAPSGTIGDHRQIEPRELATVRIVPNTVVAALHGCSDVALFARPPLNGRADLLPPELSWWFAGDSAGHARDPRARSLAVADAKPPDASLPELPSSQASEFDTSLQGNDATPTSVLAAIGRAGYAELDVHGVVAAKEPGSAFLELSPDKDGAYALDASAVRAAHFTTGPIVVLAACRAGSVAPTLRERWSLPDAFLHAGASAVVAVDTPIPDAGAAPVFEELHRRINSGATTQAAVASVRTAAPPASWVRRLVVFR